jgi:L-amino acid N-acyltransferase YncA
MSESPSFSVRDAHLADAGDIARIYTDSILARDSTMVLDPVSQAEIEDKLKGLSPEESMHVVVDARGTVVGWGIVKLYSDRPGYRLTCETSLFIDAGHRGIGLGKMLQAELLKKAREAGFHHVLVRIWAQNESSISLHRKLGFTMVGIQKEIGHVDHNWIDVAVMQCLLS